LTLSFDFDFIPCILAQGDDMIVCEMLIGIHKCLASMVPSQHQSLRLIPLATPIQFLPPARAHRSSCHRLLGRPGPRLPNRGYQLTIRTTHMLGGLWATCHAKVFLRRRNSSTMSTSPVILLSFALVIRSCSVVPVIRLSIRRYAISMMVRSDSLGAHVSHA